MTLTLRACCLLVVTAHAVAAAQGVELTPTRLRVSDNGRHFVDASGLPFFWLGDTAWMLFQKTTREQADLYLSTRARQGFTVVQAAFVHAEERVGGILVPNPYGDQAFVGGDPARPQPGYWNHVDYVVGRAAAHGLQLALLPMFVGYGGDGYKYLDADNAYKYGEFLGRRYGSQPHVFWVLGGDNSPDTPAKFHIWSEVARGINVGATGGEDYSRTLMTFHVNGNQSSAPWVHWAPWLDFNMVQVWGVWTEIYRMVLIDYHLLPVKPSGLAEGSYEDGPQYATGPIDAFKIRAQAYWSYFAGGYHTYGNGNLYHFSSYKPETTDDWVRALESPGATHMTVLATIFRSLPWWTFEPDPMLFAADPVPGSLRNVALRAADGSSALVYASHPSSFVLDVGRLATTRRVVATWIDPQSGARTRAGELPAGGTAAFTTPEGWPDALLHLHPPTP